MNETIQKLITASKELQEIPVKGQDTLRMATALTLIEQAVQSLAQAAQSEEKKEEAAQEEDNG